MAGLAIIEIDVHGKTTEEAIKSVYQILKKVDNSTYRIRIIHGYHGGTRIRSELREEFGYYREQKVKRIESGSNPGITELILREM
ncbi:MAG: Smr/MutS family protein [Lachnospiraceae bacterium]